MRVYPPRIVESLSQALQIGKCESESADGLAVSFECASAVRFSICIDLTLRRIEEIAFTSNGCGFAVAAASAISDALRGRILTELHATADLEDIVSEALGKISADRRHCIRLAADAFRKALANYRSSVVDEFQGEKALICTCFGVTEETLVSFIESDPVIEIKRVIRKTKAGSGCGSCQFLIQELIDAERNKSRF